MKKILMGCFVFVFIKTTAQIDPKHFIQHIDSIITIGIKNSEIPGAVLGVASSDSLISLRGYGYSNIKEQIRVDPYNTLFQVGSIGKLCTSITLLQEVDQHKIALNANVNDYLEDWSIESPYQKPVTPFHLLTHSAGFNDQNINYLVRQNTELEPLKIHLPKNMPSVFQEPGKEINYSNYGYALAGHLVEKTSGNSFEDQVKNTIFNRLGMANASYYLPDDYGSNSKYAKGYRGDTSFSEVKMFPRHAKPAGSVIATGEDMTLFAQALLKRDTILLSHDSYNLLLDQQFTNHPKLTGYTLGMEVQNFNGHIAYAKGGIVRGFLSVLMLFPDLDLTLFISTNTQNDHVLETLFKSLKDTFFVPQVSNAEPMDCNIQEFLGVYANKRANHETIEEFFALFSGQFNILKSESGNLRVFQNGGWHEYYPIEKDIFQNRADAYDHIIFERKKGEIATLYRNVNIGGIQIPHSYRKISWLERPRFLNDEYPYLLVFILGYLLLPLLWLGLFLIRKKKPYFLKKTALKFYYHATAFTFLGLFIWNVIGFFIPLIKLGENIAFGIPNSLISMKYFNWAMGLFSLMLLVFSIELWLKKKSTLFFRIYYTLFSLCTLSYVLILMRWHFFSVSV